MEEKIKEAIEMLNKYGYEIDDKLVRAIIWLIYYTTSNIFEVKRELYIDCNTKLNLDDIKYCLRSSLKEIRSANALINDFITSHNDDHNFRLYQLRLQNIQKELQQLYLEMYEV